jgi:hypothetical protein
MHSGNNGAAAAPATSAASATAAVVEGHTAAMTAAGMAAAGAAARVGERVHVQQWQCHTMKLFHSSNIQNHDNILYYLRITYDSITQ